MLISQLNTLCFGFFIMTMTACAAKPEQICQVKTTADGALFNHSVCRIHNHKKDTNKLKLYWWDSVNKKPFYTLTRLKKHIENDHKQLIFAMNAGMYDKKYAPLALYINHGQTYKKLNLKKGGGNFHLLPNGVFWLDGQGKAHVTESNTYAKHPKKAIFATQSGPMLVINGKLHPKFNRGSTSKKIRNGVGICHDKMGDFIQFVMSDDWVNFYEFAMLFKQSRCDDALFLDGGRASALYSQETQRHDKKYMGVMIGFTN